jgi:hypothetical protein
MHCNGYDTYRGTASTIGATLVGILSPTSNPSPTTRRSCGTSNPSGVGGGGETLRSYLKRFQTMRNRIPEVAEAVVIEDFYRGSNDSAFVRAILQKASTTSEQLFREADLYITIDERAQDLIGGAKPTPSAPRSDANQQTDKRWEKSPREEVHAAGPPVSRARGAPHGDERTLDDILDAQCLYHKDMRHTLRNCRDFKHSVGNGRPFQPLPPPPPRGGPGEPRRLKGK